MKNHTKKWLTIVTGLAVCAALVILIGGKFQKLTPQDILPESSSSVAGDVTAAPVETEPTEKKQDVVVQKPETTPTQPDNGGAVSSGTEQTIQPDVVKPAEPSESQKTDPTQKPNGEKVTTPPTTAPTTPNPTQPPKTDNGTPKNGDKKDGKIYVDGFGWIDDNGGGGSGTKADDMYENGNKVGIMD